MISSIGTMTTSLIDSTQMSQRPTEEEKFAQLDVDGSGTLDETELQAMIERMSEKMGETAPTLGQALSDLDADGDGAISFDEFEAGKPQGPPPGGPPPEQCETSSSTDLQSLLLEALFTQDEDTMASAGVLA